MDLFKAAASSFIVLMASLAPVWAGEADVIDATARQGSDGRWRISVTILHEDAGCDHYADRWEVVLDDKVIAVRTLAHPHVDEQPFTRSLSGVEIPAGTPSVVIRARDSVHGYGGQEFLLELVP